MTRFGLRDPLPEIRIPVARDIEDPIVDLQYLFTDCYDAGRYGADAGYSEQPETPVSPEQWEWSRRLLREKGILPAAG